MLVIELQLSEGSSRATLKTKKWACDFAYAPLRNCYILALNEILNG